MRQAVLIGVLAAAFVPVALASNGEPQKKLTKAGQARARAVSIYASDLGAGWKAKRSTTTDESRPRCSSYNPDQSDLVETGKYDSPDFTRQDGSFVSSSTGVFLAVRMAQAGYTRVALPALPSCFAELFKKQITKPNSAKILSSGALAFPRIGDRSNAYRLTASVRVGKTTVPVTIDIVLFNRGRIDVAMIFFSSARPLSASFEQALAGRVAARAK